MIKGERSPGHSGRLATPRRSPVEAHGSGCVLTGCCARRLTRICRIEVAYTRTYALASMLSRSLVALPPPWMPRIVTAWNRITALPQAP